MNKVYQLLIIIMLLGCTHPSNTTDPSNPPIDPPIDPPTFIGEISSAEYHSMILKLDGSLWATGYNNSGQLGLGNKTSVSTPILVMENVSKVSTCHDHTMIIKSDGSLWATGKNSLGKLGIGEPYVFAQVSF